MRTRTATLLVGVFVAAVVDTAAAAEPPARRQALTGVWQLHAVPDDPTQAELEAVKSAKWHEVHTPFSLSDLPGLDREGARKVHYAWARRTFTAPSETAFRNAVLHLHGLCWGSKIWINGQEVGEHLGAYGAYEFDLTGVLKWGGKNEILVRITGWPVIPRSKKLATNHYLHVPLMAHGPALFGWGGKQARFTGKMWIDYFDYARLERVQVLAHDNPGGTAVSTQPRRKAVSPAPVRQPLRGVLGNTGGEVRVRGLSRNYTRHYGKREVRARILRKGKAVARGRAQIPPAHTAFSSRSPCEFDLKVKVEQPDLWSPEAPNLYRAELELVQDGLVLDRWGEHFGFRRFETRRDGLYLNGKRIFLRGVCFWGEGNWWGHQRTSIPGMVKRYFIDLPKAANVRAIRHHTVPVDGIWLDLADRHGMLLLQEFPMTINYIRPDFTEAERTTFRRRVIDEFRTMLPLYWNHPSVILWVSTNESPRENAEWENGPLQRLFKAADPTRPVMRSGVESADIYDTHCYSGFWSGSEGQFARFAEGAARRGRATAKPIGNTEYVENFGGGRVTKWLGLKPKDVTQAQWQHRRRDTHAQFILEQSEVLRRLGYDITLPYAWGGGYLRRIPDSETFWQPEPNFYALRSAMSPVLASIDLADRHVAAGSDLGFDLVICDDTGTDQALTVKVLVVSGNPGFEWPTRRAKVEVIAEQVETVPPGAAGSYAPRRHAVTVRLPKKPGRYYLLAVAGAPGKPAAVSRRIISLVPPAPVKRLAGRSVVVIAAEGSLQADLKRLAPDLLFAKDFTKADVLVVGPFIHRELETVARQADEITAFAKAGGRVVVLEQDRPIPPLGLIVPQVNGHGGSSTAFRTAFRTFYAWRGLGGDDRVLRRFNGSTGAVVRRPVKPAEGDDVLLKASQGSGGLDWAVMTRRRLGKGEVVFCQMPLQRHLSGDEVDPVAQTVMVNLLARERPVRRGRLSGHTGRLRRPGGIGIAVLAHGQTGGSSSPEDSPRKAAPPAPVRQPLRGAYR